MKKITFVINELTLGGEQKVTTMIADQLSDQNEVEIINFSGSQKSYFETAVPVVNFKSESRINHFLRKGFSRIVGGVLKKNVSPFFMNRKHLNELLIEIGRTNPELIVLVAELPYYTAEIKKFFPNIKVVVWLHNPLQLYYEHIFRYSRPIFLDALKIADQVIVLTHQDVKYAKNILELEVICIYNPLTLTGHSKYQPNSTNIAVAGRYAVYQKGLDYLPRITEVLQAPWTIQLAGTGSPTEIKKVHALFSSISKERYSMLGALDKEGMVHLFSTSAFYLMTSRFEGLPLVLIEAMHFGLPIVSFDNVGSREIIGNNQYGILIEQGNIEQLTQQIKRLMNNKSLLEKYSKLSLERSKDFSMEAAMKKWSQIIND